MLVVYVNYTTATQTCIDETIILTWQPGAVTTYALPVIEIETIIEKLSSLVQYASSTNANRLLRLIQNWNTVLGNYRSYNIGLTAMFSAEAIQFVNAVNHFKAFQTGQLDAQDFASAVANTLDGLIDFPVITTMAYALNGVFYQIKETCDQVLPYNVANTIVGATGDYGGAGNTLQGVCDDFDPDAWQSFASMINGACTGISADGSPNNPLSSTPLFQQLCASETLTGDSVPGGLQTSTGPESLLGFPSDSKKLITFGANSPLQLSWTSTVTDSRVFDVQFEASRALTAELGNSYDLEIFGVGLTSDVSGGLTNTFTVHLGKTSEEDHSVERTVTVSLEDDDDGDFFAVRITEDPVYGTPVFTTMGGASKCPGETGTSRRESNVKILEIRERCGADNASPCNELTLAAGDNANFGVVIENLSPTQDEVYYILQLASYFDDYLASGGDGTYTCGVSGQMSGLSVSFSNTDLERIPYNRLVEVPFSVTNTAGSIALCNVFNDIAVQIIATCEMPTSSSEVYQYGVEYDDAAKQTIIKYDPAHRIYASNSTATFSVKWPATRRRLSDAAAPGLSHSDGNDLADAITDVMLRKLEESRLSLQSDIVTIRGQMDGMMVGGAVVLTVVLIWSCVLRSK